MIPDLIRDVDKMFVGARGNPAARVLRPELKLMLSADGSGHDQNIYASGRSGRPSPSSTSE
jgi:hypothetical protein